MIESRIAPFYFIKVRLSYLNILKHVPPYLNIGRAMSSLSYSYRRLGESCRCVCCS